MLLEEEVVHKKNFSEIQFPGEVAQHLLAVNVHRFTLQSWLLICTLKGERDHLLYGELCINIHNSCDEGVVGRGRGIYCIRIRALQGLYLTVYPESS